MVKSACSPSSEQYEPEDAISVNEIIEKNDGIFIPFKESKEVVLKFTLEDAKTKEVTKLAKTVMICSPSGRGRLFSLRCGRKRKAGEVFRKSHTIVTPGIGVIVLSPRTREAIGIVSKRHRARVKRKR